jgi:hypothetical protein
MVLECFDRYRIDYIGSDLARIAGATDTSLSLIAVGAEFAGLIRAIPDGGSPGRRTEHKFCRRSARHGPHPLIYCVVRVLPEMRSM